MSRVILLNFLLCISLWSTAQTSLDNLDLENWTESESGRFEEPDGPWATANFGVDLEVFPPATNPVEKTNDAYSGNYAAKMESLEIFFTFTSGALWTGGFELNIANPTDSPKFGVPFNGTPERFQCYYKYLPMNGDSMDIYSTLFLQGDTVAHCQLRSSQTVDSYTFLDLEYDYKMTGVEPDSIQVVFTSSAAGFDFEGQLNSQLFVDEVKLVNSVGIIDVLSPEIQIKAYPNPASALITLEFDKNLSDGHLLFFDSMGRQMHRQITQNTRNNIDVSDWQSGTYYFLLKDKDGHDMSSGSFLVR